MTPEQKIWQEVILTAFEDATSKSTAREMMLERPRAHRWISQPNKDFNMICMLAGMDAQFLRDSYNAGRVDHAALHDKREGKSTKGGVV